MMVTRGNGGDGGTGLTATKERRRTESGSIGRRAKRADGRDVRGHRYKPPIAPVWLVSAPAYIPTGRLRRPIEPPFVVFVAFVPFVVKSETPFVSVPSFLL